MSVLLEYFMCEWQTYVYMFETSYDVIPFIPSVNCRYFCATKTQNFEDVTLMLIILIIWHSKETF